MAAKIIPKKSSVSEKVPGATDLEVGEIAVNLTDAKIYVKHSDNSIVNLSGASELHTHSISQVTGLQSELDDKLDSSEYTAADIKTKYESNADTNAYTDAEKQKLADIEEGTVTSVNGQDGVVSLSTTDIPEGTNLYFTDTRAQGSISVAGDLTYSNGVISFSETYSTAGEIKTAYESNTNTNAFTDSEQTKLSGIEAGAQVNTVTSVASKTGAVSLVKGDVGLGNVRNVASYSQTEADTKFVEVAGDAMTGPLLINTTSDGLNDLQVGGSSRVTGNAGFGASDPTEKVDVAGDARVRNEGAMKFGGSGATDSQYAIQFNASTKSLDFNFLGA